MKTALLIGHNDLRLFLRNRASFVWLFVVPVAFVYFMGFANRGPGSPGNPRPSVLVENRDAGFLGGVLLDELGAQGLNVLSPTNAADAKRGVRIPADFTTNVLAGQQGKVGFFEVEGGGDAAAALVEIRLVRALIAVNSHLLEQAAASTGQPTTAGSLRALQQQENPVTLDARFAGRKPIPTGFNLSLPGVIVMYLLMNLLIFGGASMAWERRSGVLRRMMVHPVPRPALIAGKLYGLMLLAAVQIAFFLLAGRYWFKVNLGDHLGGILLVLLVYAWVAASLGVLVGSLIQNEDKVVGVCVLASIVAAALGGCWWPLEIVPDNVKVIAHCVPTSWAMDALHQLITFGGGLPAASHALGVLVLFGLAANAAAVKFFRV
jgi:ABC-2 type transport system permease protein